MIDNLQHEGFAIFKQPLQWCEHGGLNLAQALDTQEQA